MMGLYRVGFGNDMGVDSQMKGCNRGEDEQVGTGGV